MHIQGMSDNGLKRKPILHSFIKYKTAANNTITLSALALLPYINVNATLYRLLSEQKKKKKDEQTMSGVTSRFQQDFSVLLKSIVTGARVLTQR